MRFSTDILVFCDSKETQKMLNSFLSLDQSTIQFAPKEEMGIKKFCDQEFDLVIVEISQPLISEIVFIERLRMLNKKIPIVIISEYFHDTKSMVFQDNVSEFISMPVTLEKLSATVKDVIHKTNDKASDDKEKSQITLENKKLFFLYEISKSLTSITDFDKLLNAIIKIATDALNAERATLFVLDNDTSELWSRVGSGIDKKEIRFPKDQGIAGEVVSTERIIRTDNPYGHPSFNKSIDTHTGFTTRSLICVPLKNLHGEILGAFQVLNKKDGFFSSSDELFFSAIASTVAIALDNTLLHEEIKKKYDEIHRLCDELYIAQNQMLADSNYNYLLDISNYFKKIREQYSIEREIAKLKSTLKKDKDATVHVESLQEMYNRTLDKVEIYLNNMKKEISKLKTE